MFSWNLEKAIANFIKHGVSFEEASTVFADLDALDLEDVKHSKIEKRYLRLGSSILNNVLVIVYTIRRDKNGKETIRIISARKASKKERKVYFGQ